MRFPHWNSEPVGIAVLAILLGLPGRSLGDGPAKPPPIFKAARDALNQGQTHRSKVLGFFGDSKRNFTEAPAQGGILVGFDVGVGPDGNIEAIWAVRPIFRTAAGDVIGADRGLFYDRSVPDGKRLKIRKSRVKRTVALRTRSATRSAASHSVPG